MTLPPPLLQIYRTPILAAEVPAGLRVSRVVQLGRDRRHHVIAGVSIIFTYPRGSDSAGYALFSTTRYARAYSALLLKFRNSGVHAHTAVRERLVVAVTGTTAAQAERLLAFALGHLQRSR